jgi:hypothetical protein
MGLTGQGCGQVTIGARLCEPQHVGKRHAHWNYPTTRWGAKLLRVTDPRSVPSAALRAAARWAPALVWELLKAPTRSQAAAGQDSHSGSTPTLSTAVVAATSRLLNRHSAKHQAPTPSSKQISNTKPTKKSRAEAKCRASCSSKLGASFELGAWSLDLAPRALVA